jgi:hypothetical protein
VQNRGIPIGSRFARKGKQPLGLLMERRASAITSPNESTFNEGGSLQTRLKEGASYELSKWLKGAWQPMTIVDTSGKPIRSKIAIEGLSRLNKKNTPSRTSLYVA